MSQRAERELDRLLHIARPEVSRDFTDDVMSRIAADDHPMPIAPAIVLPSPAARGRSITFPFRGRRFPAAPPASLFVRTAIVTAPLVAMLALVFVLATTLFTDKGTERRNVANTNAEDTAARIEQLKGEIERNKIALNAVEHDTAGMSRCSSCHDLAKLASLAPNTGNRLQVVAFVDLEAPNAFQMMRGIEAMAIKFADKVSIEVRNPRAGSAATRASLAAADKGAYWQMVECLTEHGTGTDGIATCADDAKLDRVALEQKMASPEITAAIDADVERARVTGIAGPSIVIDGRVFAGPRAHVDARQFVNVALARRTL